MPIVSENLVIKAEEKKSQQEREEDEDRGRGARSTREKFLGYFSC